MLQRRAAPPPLSREQILLSLIGEKEGSEQNAEGGESPTWARPWTMF